MTLVAMGTSDTPMRRKQHRLGLNLVPVANGGRAVEVYQTGDSYRTGRADEDPHVPVGITRELGARSLINVPLDVDGVRRSVFEVGSRRLDAFSPADLRFLEAVARWVGMVAHRAELAERVARPGIPPSLLPTLFDRVARGSASTGLGLGLYLARGIAEAHGGTLTVDSAPGQGTSFCLSLQLGAEPSLG